MTQRKPTAIDLFCGAGGFSEGARRAGVNVIAALNHDANAIACHLANHPGAHHERADVWLITAGHLVRGLGRVDMLLASPSCTHHSRAKGGQPLDKGLRSQPDAVLHYVRELLAAKRGPRIVIVENVPEFRDWGPLDDGGRPIPERKGEDFQRWVEELRLLGARVEWRVLNAADFGAPTHRRRLFVVASFVGAIPWPEPTHGPGRAHPWVPVASCIDFATPACSIFATREEARAWAKRHGRGVPVRPLASNTLRRVAAGVKRYVLDAVEPFVITATGQPGPVAAVVERVSAPGLAAYYGSERDGQAVTEPMRTATTKDRLALFGCELSRQLSPEQLAGAHRVAAFLRAHGVELEHDVAVVRKGDDLFVIVDITLRMLEPRELLQAQGFPAEYQLHGTRAEQIERIGNSVSPPVAAALIRANVAIQRRRKTNKAGVKI